MICVSGCDCPLIMSDSTGDEGEKPTVNQLTKKRKVHGRMSSVCRQLRAMSHTLGSDCKCSMFQCFKNITPHERDEIIKQFNLLGNWNDQSSYLTSLISVTLIARRRPRHDDPVSRDCSFRYIVRVKRNDCMREIPVCQNAFIALHGITKRRLATIQSSMKETGKSPKDKRGTHNNRPWKLSKETEEAIVTHIGSFTGRKSHYGKGKTDKLYLPEELSIKKCHEMYQEKYPNLPVSLESYRKIFNNRFNISFGYPRKDTCSICDKFQAEVKGLNARLSQNVSEEEKLEITNKIKGLTTENQVHNLKAVTFYTRKRIARKYSKKTESYEAICMDFQRNLPLPNITTNDVYYKRQLSFYSFNIHQLSNRDSVFYTYTEVEGNKGANEVISFLHNYVTEVLDPKIRDLVIFCDSCSGQNKNYAVFFYLHFLIHNIKRLDSIKIVYPMRGHSYMECDKNSGLIKKTTYAEVPTDWGSAFETARANPMPFKVIKVEQEILRDWTTFLKNLYEPKCTFKTRPIREATVVNTDPLFKYRTTYNGPWEEVDLMYIFDNPEQAEIQPEYQRQGPDEFLWPQQAYNGKCFLA